MSFLSSLFGCNKTVEITGPDFGAGINNVVHIDQIVSIEYRLPGNMSKQFGF